MEEEDNSITMVDVLKEQEAFEEDAKAVLGASDDKNCTYSLGYVKRQALYACLTCCPDSLTDPDCRAGVCLACSLACHENHNLVELYTKRNFRCDCGGPKFSHNCNFNPKRSENNNLNEYNQNFSGLYCTCHRPYPDPDDNVEDEMIQCIICEDWFHSRHLNTNLPPTGHYSEMICEGCTEKNDFLENYLCYEISRNISIDKTSEQQDVDIEKISEDITKTTEDQLVETDNNVGESQLEICSTIEDKEKKGEMEKESEKQELHMESDVTLDIKESEKQELHMESDVTLDIKESDKQELHMESDVTLDIKESEKQELHMESDVTLDIKESDKQELHMESDVTLDIKESEKQELHMESDVTLDIKESDKQELHMESDVTLDIKESEKQELHMESDITLDLKDCASNEVLPDDFNADVILKGNETNQIDESLQPADDSSSNALLTLETSTDNNEDAVKDNLPVDADALLSDTSIDVAQEPQISLVESQFNNEGNAVSNEVDNNTEYNIGDIQEPQTNLVEIQGNGETAASNENNTDKDLEVEDVHESIDQSIVQSIGENTRDQESEEALTKNDVGGAAVIDTLLSVSNPLNNVNELHSTDDNISVNESENGLENIENRESKQEIVSDIPEEDKDSYQCGTDNPTHEVSGKMSTESTTGEISTESATASSAPVIASEFHDESPVDSLVDEKISENPTSENKVHVECDTNSSSENVERTDANDKPITIDNGDILAEQNIAEILDDISKCPDVLNSNEAMDVSNQEVIPIVSETINDMSSMPDKSMSVENASGITKLNSVSDAQEPNLPQESNSDVTLDNINVIDDAKPLHGGTEENSHANENIDATIENNFEDITENISDSVISSIVPTEVQSSSAQNIELPINTSGAHDEMTTDKQVQGVCDQEMKNQNEHTENICDSVITSSDVIESQPSNIQNTQSNGVCDVIADNIQVQETWDEEMKDQSDKEGLTTDKNKGIENDSNTLNVNTAAPNSNQVCAMKRKPDSEFTYGNVSPMKKKIKQERIYITECIKPIRDINYKRKGATFWPSDWRNKLCSCKSCVDTYNEKNVGFILDFEDTVSAYEDLGKIKTESSSSQYEKGMEALSSLGHVQQINAITEYNKMKEKLLEFLKTFKDKKEVVKEEDIKGFFAGMKPKREPDGVYFCR